MNSAPVTRFVRSFNRPLAQILLASLALASFVHAQSTTPRERTSFDADWRFIKGDPAEAGTSLAYVNIKTALLANVDPTDFIVKPTADNLALGKDISYARPDFNDSSWRQLNLPHDWGIEGPFDESLNGATGRLPYFGTAWYRKTFTVPAEDQNKKIYLDVDGAMAYASIWLNGQYLGGWPYGYASFRVDLTSALKFGGNNVIAIRLDNPNGSSRWYPGGGLYRNLWLVKESPVHVAHWGEYVTTPQITADSATVNVRVDLQNDSATPATVSVRTQIFAVNADGKINGVPLVSTSPATLPLAANDLKTVGLSLSLSRPRLWDLQHPNLYAAVTTIQQDGKDVDSATVNFGIRTIKFDPNQGFLLNGRRVQINGVCDHSDLGPLGTVVNVRGLERQIQLLQEMGCNAIRTSHNMPAPELLDLCDRMGMLVMDESFDCWERQKVAGDYHLLFPDWHEKDIRAEVRRDRNHPSIILWSVGNEIPQQGSARGNEILNELTKDVHEEDPTRMTVTANNNTGFTDFNPAEYVYGFNYEPTHTGTKPKYDIYHQQHPDVCILGSETSSDISARGVYVYPVTDNKSGGALANHLMSSYDLYAPSWAYPPDDEFARQDQFPFIAGEFVWTGFDYIGEPTNNNPTPGDTSRSSYFGIIDLDGFKKDRFYIYQAHWKPDFPMAHLVPQNWNWKGFEGETTPVFVYTSGDSAELFLNGKSLGKKTKAPLTYRLRWDDVKFAPGILHVIAYKNGKEWSSDTVKTTDVPAQISATPDRAAIANDGQDLSYVTMTIQDKDGLTVPDAMNALHYEISGPGEIVAVDNGDETSLAPIQGTQDSKAFNGLALVIVRAKAGQTGPITLTATSQGLRAAAVTIAANAAKE
jgi:beta-galactosidase